MRRQLILIHKYLGLTAGVILCITGLTGSLLVFDHALDEQLNPKLQHLETDTDPAPLSEVLANAKAAYPDSQPTRIYLARKPGTSHMLRFSAAYGESGPVEVSVHPRTAEVLAVRTWGEYGMSWIYKLHYTLLAGKTGKNIVGVLGIILLFFCLSGVIIWWPREGQWHRALSIALDKGQFRFYFDLHKSIGVFVMLVLTVSAFTGISIVFHTPMENAARSVLPWKTEPAPQSTVRSKSLVESHITLDEAQLLAQAQFPQAELKRVYLPRSESDAWVFVFRQPEEAWSTFGASRVWIDQYSGEVLNTWNHLHSPAGNTFMEWQFPLHNGDALGLPGRILMLIGGLMPALLFCTGFLMWRKKHRGRRNKTRS